MPRNTVNCYHYLARQQASSDAVKLPWKKEKTDQFSRFKQKIKARN